MRVFAPKSLAPSGTPPFQVTSHSVSEFTTVVALSDKFANSLAAFPRISFPMRWGTKT